MASKRIVKAILPLGKIPEEAIVEMDKVDLHRNTSLLWGDMVVSRKRNFVATGHIFQ